MPPAPATAAGRRVKRAADPPSGRGPAQRPPAESRERPAARRASVEAPAPRAAGHPAPARSGGRAAGLVTQPVRISSTLAPPRSQPATRPSRRARTAAAGLEAKLAPPRQRRQSQPPPRTSARPNRSGESDATHRVRPARRVRTREAPRLVGRLQAPRLDRIVRGRAWIPVLGAMLILIVGLRVEVLKLGSSVGTAVAQATTLQSSNAVLRAQISALSDNQRIERIASGYGMHMPNPLDVHFLQASQGRRVQAAIRNITVPSRIAFLSSLAAEQQHDALTTAAGAGLSAVGAAPSPPPSSSTATAPGAASSTTGGGGGTSGLTAASGTGSGSGAGSTTAGSTASGAANQSAAATGATRASGTQGSGTGAAAGASAGSGVAAGTAGAGSSSATNTAAGVSGTPASGASTNGAAGLAG